MAKGNHPSLQRLLCRTQRQVLTTPEREALDNLSASFNFHKHRQELNSEVCSFGTFQICGQQSKIQCLNICRVGERDDIIKQSDCKAVGQLGQKPSKNSLGAFMRRMTQSCFSAGPAELGGRVGTATVPGYAAPGTPLHNPETWEGKSPPPNRYKCQPHLRQLDLAAPSSPPLER